MPSLQEAKAIVSQISRQADHSQEDIAARTELSHARQILAQVRGLLVGQGQIERMRSDIDRVDGKINDLLQYIDTSLNDVRNVSWAEFTFFDEILHAIFFTTHSGIPNQ